MELWKQELLDDEYFLNPYLSNNRNLTKEKLSAWLTTFNKRQAQLGETYTSARDYRQHFVNWFKYRDALREDPHTFLSQSNNKATAVIPAVTSYMKTPQQLLKEQEEAERNCWSKLIGK